MVRLELATLGYKLSALAIEQSFYDPSIGKIKKQNILTLKALGGVFHPPAPPPPREVFD